jgi:uncharacterized SAM-binding protein YcdF (DUF218 family)
LLALLLLGGGFWAGGFVWFLHLTTRAGGPPPPHADGIVALTGGPGRVELALHLLAAGHADKLLVTGIGGGTDLGTLGRLAGIDTAPLASRITLGRYAASTRGNGVEAAAWAARTGISSLIVVTAGYHMPRALAELRSALPGVRLYPLPVRPAAGGGTADHRPGLRLEAEEFTKYVFTLSGLSAWLPRREGGPVMLAPPGTEG